MHYTDSLDVVAQECRFLLGRRSLDELLPDIGRSVPPVGYVDFMDTTQHRTLLGYPVVARRMPGGASLQLAGTLSPLGVSPGSSNPPG